MVYESGWLHRLLPSTCLLCGAAGNPALDLCSACARDLPWIDNGCRRCAMPLPAGLDGACGRCLLDPPRFAACVAPLRYEYPVRELVRRFKFDADLACGRVLAELLAEQLKTTGDYQSFTLIPVPLHPARRCERGFNQSERIARVLARRLHLHLAHGLVERVVQAADQKTLAASARRANLQSAFEARGCPGLRVAIVDDVITTGATANAVSEALLRAGAREVRVWCVARAI